MTKRLIIIIISFSVVIGISYGVIQYFGVKPIKNPIIETPIGQSITLEGEIACLPGKTGFYPLECAIGLKGENGNYYALKNLSQEDLMEGKYSTGQRVEVSGIFTTEGNKTSKYNIKGTIDVAKIKAISKTENIDNSNLPREIFKHWYILVKKIQKIQKFSDRVIIIFLHQGEEEMDSILRKMGKLFYIRLD